MSQQLLRPRQVYELIQLSPMQVWRLRAAGRFPEPISLGVNSKAFLKEEIDHWIAARVAERDSRRQTPRTVENQEPGAVNEPSQE